MNGKELKALRKALRWTQADMADRLGFSREWVGQMERGSAAIEPRTEYAVRWLFQEET